MNEYEFNVSGLPVETDHTPMLWIGVHVSFTDSRERDSRLNGGDDLLWSEPVFEGPRVYSNAHTSTLPFTCYTTQYIA